jgi:hypothetical protein
VTGVEPTVDFDATTNSDCGYDFCQGVCAARALQAAGSNCLDLTLLDLDLKWIITAWDNLPLAMRKGVVAFIGGPK